MKIKRKSYKLPLRKTCLIQRLKKNNNFYCFNFSVRCLKAKEQSNCWEKIISKSRIPHSVKLSYKDEGKDKFKQVAKTLETPKQNDKLKNNFKCGDTCDGIQDSGDLNMAERQWETPG